MELFKNHRILKGIVPFKAGGVVEKVRRPTVAVEIASLVGLPDRLHRGCRLQGVRHEQASQYIPFERLLENPYFRERRRDRLGAVPGHEDERHFSCAQDVGDGIGHLAAKIDVKNAGVDRLAVDSCKRFVDRAEWPHHVKVEIAKVLFHHHGDQAFILNYQDALA